MSIPPSKACAGAAGRRPPTAARRLPDPRRAIVPGLLVLGALTAGCAGKQAARSPRVSVTVATVERRAMPLELVATGSVEPIQSANVGSQVGGVVTRLEIREGQDVAAGQALVQLDSRPFAAALEQARGDLARSRAAWETARLDVERARSLFEQKLLSAAEWDRLRSVAASAAASVGADSGAFERARLDLNFATIRAPISGRTGTLNVHVGDLVKAATSDPLVSIIQLRPIRVRFTIPEGDLDVLQRHRRSDLRVRARLSPHDSSFVEGRLGFVDNAVDAATGTLLLKGEFDNRDGRLWPGQFVEVRLVLATEPDRVVVPAVAVTSGQQGSYVYVMGADSTVSSRPVTLARTQGSQAIVASGLEPGEIVVTDGQFRLAPGARVVVRGGGQGSTP